MNVMKSFFLLSNLTGDLAEVQQSPFGGNERHFAVVGLQVTLAYLRYTIRFTVCCELYSLCRVFPAKVCLPPLETHWLLPSLYYTSWK